MNKSELRRLSKLEDKINKIARDELGFDFIPVEYDVVPEEKMWEILAYRGPTQISNWKFGRDFERQKTIANNISPHLPNETVIFGDPCRAYLMNNNPFAVQVLVMAHVVGHSIFFKENKAFEKSRIDMGTVLSEAHHRFNEYEKIYGIDEIERTVDAGHSIQMHSSPFEIETEDEKRIRIFDQVKKVHRVRTSEFADVILPPPNEKLDVENYNKELYRLIKRTTPVEPTEDLLRYIIDNSPILEDWQKDILEVLRYEGQYYWPIIRTKFANEGFAVYIHEKICKKLFEDGDLSSEEHGQYNYLNALVKAQNRMSMNPYLIGSYLWSDIEKRWDKGQHGREWDECTDLFIKDNWDTKEMAGIAKIKEVLPVYYDWMFFQDFLTPDTIDKLDMYIYLENEYPDGTIEYVKADYPLDEIKQIIINSFINTGIPKIEIVDGNLDGSQKLLLNHKYVGSSLDRQYTEETLKHIYNMWGRDIFIKTVYNDKEVLVSLKSTTRK